MSIKSIMSFNIFPLSSTIDLVNEFIKLKQSQQKEELESTNWKTLENAYYQHLKWRFNYPKRVFSQQIITGLVISIVVLILIISGLVFSFWQLKYALEVGDFTALTTEASIETAGKVSINSSIIGAIVLIISLAFFYLYLKNVFQIQYPTPPHVGFGETDLKEEIKLKLFGEKEKSKENGQEIDEFTNKLLLNFYLNSLKDEKNKKRKGNGLNEKSSEKE